VGAKAVDDHPIWAYFADRFGLQVVGHLEPLPGVPPTTKHLEEIIGTMKADGVRIVLASAYYDPRYARFVSEATQASVLRMANQVEAVPEASSYVAMIDHDVQQVATALAAKK
jgi:ABC-type Zn uptake system ZnuABC Zn-binding protein ZnuA